MTIHLTLEQALDGLEKAVAKKGADFKYEAPIVDEEEGHSMCMYFENGQPSCIVGHVFAEHGVTDEDLGDWNWDATVITLVDQGLLEVDDRTRTALRRAQQAQDNGVPWGAALAEAKAVVTP